MLKPLLPIVGPALVGLLALTACAGPSASSVPSPATTTATTQQSTELAVILRDFKIEPATLTASGAVTFAVTSQGPTPHNFTIRDANNEIVARSKDLRTGDADLVEASLAAGEYTFFCAFAGHESLGMHGTLTVTP
ncbi:MAG: cupredoxin domain-containing protein [Candidatus Limnocylindrales bacterium]